MLEKLAFNGCGQRVWRSVLAPDCEELKRKVTTYSPLTGVPLIAAGRKRQLSTVLTAAVITDWLTRSLCGGLWTEITRPFGAMTNLNSTFMSFGMTFQSCGFSLTCGL